MPHHVHSSGSIPGPAGLVEDNPNTPLPPAAELRPITIRALLWSEWFSHSKLFLGFLVAWLVLFWAVPLLVHPLWILAYGVVFALVAGPAMGGTDVINGCEEFMLAFPATRKGRFRARTTVGLGGLVLFTAMDLGVLGLNLSDVLARLFLSTGLMQPVQINQPGLLYGLVAAFPAAVFAFSFSIAALARTRTVAFTSWLWGSLFALGILRGSLEMEEWLFERFNGAAATPLLTVATAAVLWLADKLYQLKEAGTEAPPLKIPLSWWGWMVAVALAAIGVVALIDWFAANFIRLI